LVPHNIPDEHTKGFLVAHLHQQRANEEAKTLTVANLVIIQAEALQDTAQHLLPLAFRILEHFHAWKAPAQVFVDDVLVRT